MHVSVFPCPYCGARLRLRDRSLAGRTFPCPDCRTAVTVAAGPDGRLAAAPSGRDVPTAVEDPPSSASTPGAVPQSSLPALSLARVRRSVRERLLSSSGIGWSVAALAAVLLGVFLFVDRGESTPGPAPQSTGEQPVAKDGIPPAAAPAPETIDIRLANLGELMTAYLAEHGHFPAPPGHESGLANEDRLSWLAALAVAEQRLKAFQPQYDRPWHDPLNDRFVRQRIHEFQNPLIPEVVGAQGYPATHFAGIAGVGADASTLPKEHGRAGIFGEDRLTAAADVADGLSHTWMVAGIENDLTSWAANGRGTLRSLSAEPYLRGPDGLGTGQPDGMLALMADGSVRFLAAESDPRLLRRLAAMRDGLPLDLSVPGEPGDSAGALPEPVVTVPPELPPEPAAIDPAAEEPITVLLSPDGARFDVEGALSLRVLQFTQAEPVPARVLLQQLEELGGVPFDRSEVLASPAAERLEQPITISLTETTFADILRAVLAELEMSFTSGPHGITLHPSPAAP